MPHLGIAAFFSFRSVQAVDDEAVAERLRNDDPVVNRLNESFAVDEKREEHDCRRDIRLFMDPNLRGQILAKPSKGFLKNDPEVVSLRPRVNDVKIHEVAVAKTGISGPMLPQISQQTVENEISGCAGKIGRRFDEAISIPGPLTHEFEQV